jgi:hypothetical protein
LLDGGSAMWALSQLPACFCSACHWQCLLLHVLGCNAEGRECSALMQSHYQCISTLVAIVTSVCLCHVLCYNAYPADTWDGTSPTSESGARFRGKNIQGWQNWRH